MSAPPGPCVRVQRARGGRASVARATGRSNAMAGDSEQNPRALWKRRYSSRAPTLRQEHARRYVDGGLVVFDPAGPYPGVDGSTYHPGGLDEDKGLPAALPVVVVASRGMAEILVGGANWRG